MYMYTYMAEPGQIKRGRWADRTHHAQGEHINMCIYIHNIYIYTHVCIRIYMYMG